MEFALSSPPVDGVSRVRWLDANYLLVSSWDGSVSVHEVGQQGSRRVGQYSHQGPVLDVTVGEPGCGVSLSGGLDMAVLRHDFETGVSDVLGSHTGAVKCVEYSAARGMVLTGSWDKSVRVWDARSGGGGGGGSSSGSGGGGISLASLPLPDRCYTMATSGADTLVVGCAGRHVQVFDLRRLGGGAASSSSSSSSAAASPPALLQARESSMKHQTRAIQCLNDGSGFVTASVEGRVAVDFFDMAPEVQAKKYAFKCHRQKMPSGEERAFPVNALSFHPGFGTFATGAGDATVCIWDHLQKKRVSTLSHHGGGHPSASASASASTATPAPFPTSISSLAFSPTGTHLAIAASYGWEQGDPASLPGPPPPDAIFIRALGESDVKPRSKGTSGAAGQ